jgi:hypothetical protein
VERKTICKGLPEVRLKMIDRFRAAKGSGLLNMCLDEKVIGTPLSFSRCITLLRTVGDAIPTAVPGVDQGALMIWKTM